MPRYAPLITLDEFKQICQTKLKIGSDEFDIYELPKKIEKDLSKLNFDFENYCIGNAHPSYLKYPSDHSGFWNYPCGYETLENGLPVLFVNAGGDWETPICFCIYFDGKDLRGYIPSDGNCYNKKEKCAYGSEDEPLEEDQQPQQQGEPDKIRIDVMNRIIIK
jgi:hypothetical protein